MLCFFLILYFNFHIQAIIYINLYSHKFIKRRNLYSISTELVELIEYFRPNYNQIISYDYSDCISDISSIAATYISALFYYGKTTVVVRKLQTARRPLTSRTDYRKMERWIYRVRIISFEQCNWKYRDLLFTTCDKERDKPRTGVRGRSILFDNN